MFSTLEGNSQTRKVHSIRQYVNSWTIPPSCLEKWNEREILPISFCGSGIAQTVREISNSPTRVSSDQAARSTSQRHAANRRERKRMRLINAAFVGLSAHLPPGWIPTTNEPVSPKLMGKPDVCHSKSSGNPDKHRGVPYRRTYSKVEVLRATIEYIMALRKLLDELSSHSSPSDRYTGKNPVDESLGTCNKNQYSYSRTSTQFCPMRSTVEVNIVNLHLKSKDICVSWRRDPKNPTLNLCGPTSRCVPWSSSLNRQPLQIPIHSYLNVKQPYIPLGSEVNHSPDTDTSTRHEIRVARVWWPERHTKY